MVQFLATWVETETKLKAIKENVYHLGQIIFISVYSTGQSPTVSEDVQ